MEVYLTSVRKLQSFNLEGEPFVPVLVWISFLLVLIASIGLSEKIDRFLNGRAKAVIRNLGLMTYPLYLTHSLVGGFVIYKLSSSGFEPIMSLIFALIVSAAVAFLVVGLEQRIIRKDRKVYPNSRVR